MISSEYIKTLYQSILNEIDYGIMYVDKHDFIVDMNEKAKKMFGISIEKDKYHSAGTIESGDIVLIADNSIGYDDGGLTPDDLSCININDKEIETNDMLVAVGVMNSHDIEAVYKHIPNNHLAGSLSLASNFLGKDINITINAADRISSISIDGESFNMPFVKCVGHIVVLSGTTGKVKFFQTRGYTLRKESIHDLLKGYHFSAKGRDVPPLEVRGVKVQMLFEGFDLLDRMHAIMFDGAPPMNNEIVHINLIITLCSIQPVYINGEIDGVIFKLIDTIELDELLKIRNQTIIELEKGYMDMQITELPEVDLYFTRFIGNSQAIKKCKYLAYKASKIKSNVIITGESGTGKSQLAYEIHKMQDEKAPFIEVNCGSIPETLFESEMFGYVGGAFTGALPKGNAGYFERANGGTIFLDEIAEIPLSMQVKLLQVLQSKRFYRVGSSTPVECNVRIIAATNKNLKDAVRSGSFREDLYYRLNVFPISIPPLRERKSDLYILINNLTSGICEENNLPEKQYSGSALNKLINYSWPGNVRELQNVIERAIMLSASKLIFPEYIDIISDEKPYSLKEILADAEKKAIIDAINISNGDYAKAINSLGISRSNFYDKIKRYGLE